MMAHADRGRAIWRASGAELALERRAKARRHASVADPLAQPLRLREHGVLGLGADVLEQPHDDLAAVLALRPAAHDPAVGPDRRADVAAAIEAHRAVLAEIPRALLPAHRRGIERRQQ